MLINWEQTGRWKGAPAEQEPWTAEMQEDDFFRWISDNSNVALQRYQAGDIRGVYKIFDRYKAMRKFAKEDPLRSLLETGTVTLLTILAKHQIDELHFAGGMEIYETAVDLLEDKATRYRAEGRAPRPDSLKWILIIGGLANAKWIAPDEYRDAVLTAHQMIYRYFKTETTVRRNMILMPQKKDHKRNILINLANTAAAILRFAMRFSPDRVDELKLRIDDYHGKYFWDEDMPFIWSLAITEEYLKDQPDPARLEQLYYREKLGYKELLGGKVSQAFSSGALNEFIFITRSMKHNLVLLEG